jgi:hypothetical protein
VDDKRRDGKGKILGRVTCIVWCAGGKAELRQRGEPPPSSLQRRLPERLTGYPVRHSCRHPLNVLLWYSSILYALIVYKVLEISPPFWRVWTLGF